MSVRAVLFGLTVWAWGVGAPSTRPQSWGQAAPTAPSRFPRIWQIIAYMRTIMASIATGQLRHCVSVQQVSLLSRPRILALRRLKALAQIHYKPSLPHPARMSHTAWFPTKAY